jgi:hypothetical protein
LALSVKLSEVMGLEGETLIIAVPFALHAERLNNIKNSELIRNLLVPLIGDVTLKTMVDSSRMPEILPVRTDDVPVPMTPKVLPKKPAVAVTSGDELWDSLVSAVSGETVS